jgi:DNA-binding NarL/FixJ family response regulator
MDKPTYDAAQQGALLCLLDPEHERRLAMFLNGLRNDPQWTEAQINDIEEKIRELLRCEDLDGDPVDGDPVDGDPVANGKLSAREQEVLRLIAEGHTNKDIATRFNLSAKTVETYKTRAMGKLNIKSRADIVRYAQKHEWL